MTTNTAKAIMDNDHVTRSFQVRVEKVEWLQAQFAKLAKRAAKIGCAAPTLTLLDSVNVTETNRHGIEVVVRKTNIEVSGEVPKYQGWAFAATLQHLYENGQLTDTVVHNVSMFEAPERYRAAGPDCEHCGYKRRRNDTYLVLHDDGTWKQVGSTCIDDFLGGKGLDALAKQADLIAEALGLGGSCGTDDVGGPSGFSVRFFLGACYTVMQEQGGFLGRTKAREQGGTATADIVMGMLQDPDRVHFAEGAAERGEAAYEWAAAIADPAEGEPPLSEFLHNLRAVARLGFVTERLAGFAAAIAFCYDREQRRSQSQDDVSRNSRHVGEVGDRLRGFRARVREVKDFTARGWGYLYVVVGADRNLYSFFSSTALVAGKCYTVTGTVKEHREFDGVCQTSLNRVKVEA